MHLPSVTMIVHVLRVDRFSISPLAPHQKLLIPPDWDWFKLTCARIAQVCSTLRLCWPGRIMAIPDWQTDYPDGAAQQMLQTFQCLAPLLDRTLQLEPNPGATKRIRVDQPPKGNGKHAPKQGDHPQDVQTTLQLMARLMLRLDRDMQMLSREHTFLWFFSCKEPQGALTLLVQKAADWHQQALQPASSSTMTPLRQTLLQVLISAVMTRLQKLAEANETSELKQAALKNHLLLPDQTIPYMEWNGHQKCLQLSKKTPVSLPKMGQHLQELQDMFRDVGLIQRFHALPVKSTSEVAPWRLQLSMRGDRPFELLQHLCHSQVWTMVGANLKLHSLTQSSQATSLADHPGLTSPGKSKGKGKQKHQLKPTQPKKETPWSLALICSVKSRNWSWRIPITGALPMPWLIACSGVH